MKLHSRFDEFLDALRVAAIRRRVQRRRSRLQGLVRIHSTLQHETTSLRVALARSPIQREVALVSADVTQLEHVTAVLADVATQRADVTRFCGFDALQHLTAAL